MYDGKSGKLGKSLRGKAWFTIARVGETIERTHKRFYLWFWHKKRAHSYLDRKYILTNIMHWNIQISDKFDTQLFFIGAEDHFIGSATSAKAVKVQRFDSFDQFFNSWKTLCARPCNFSFQPVLIFGKKDPYDIDQWMREMPLI